MTIFSSFSANFPLHYHTILAINCVHASNWFTHLQPTRQIDGQNDNFVPTVIYIVLANYLATIQLHNCPSYANSKNVVLVKYFVGG